MACLAALTACSQPEGSVMQQGAVYEWPDHAERFRWRTLNEGNCLEVLAANDEILATVYRDSAALMGDAARGQTIRDPR